MNWLLAVAGALASAPAGLRWLRVAQREHYLPGVSRFAVRWWRSSPGNLALACVALLGVLGAVYATGWAFLVVGAQIGPIGLPVRGTTAPLAWTGRLRRLATTTGLVLFVCFLLAGFISQPLLVAIPLFGLPALVDLSLMLLSPLERRLGRQWVDRAAGKLGAVGADVVAITGSYGKTTTKGYVTSLLSGTRRVVASPASFNNRMGLARAINENLVPGTQVFVAEMGTYGRGEIAELCEWIAPRVAAIVSIGPVHLERFRSLDNIVTAKSEILDRADVGVICIDNPLLATLAEERSRSMEILRVSGDGGVSIDGVRVTDVPEGVFGANLAVALGICVALGVDVATVLPKVDDLTSVDHRQTVVIAGNGYQIVDDTFNSNPDGARSALNLLMTIGGSGKTAVATPGMVELGREQGEENRKFAAEAASLVDHLVVVGRTNRRALVQGSHNGRATVTVVDSRDEAVAWARANLGEGDAILYENDLPDHYP